MKTCAYKDGNCFENYNYCGIYGDERIQDKDLCESIVDYYGDGYIDYEYKCVYVNNPNYPDIFYCDRVQRTCEDYKIGDPEDSCLDVYFDEKPYSFCDFKDNTCLEKARICPNDHPYTNENYDFLDKETCEGLIHRWNNYKCVWDENNKCVGQKKNCAEYTGSDSRTCQNYISTNNRKKCSLVNEQCIEKISICEDYKSSDDLPYTCESITPYDEKGNKLLGKKCQMIDNNCKMVKKECSEYNSEPEICEQIFFDDGIKNCIYKDNQCIEQYKDCDAYNDNEDVIEKTICESIKLNGLDNERYKCVFEEGETKNICYAQRKMCSDSLSESQCYNYAIPSDTFNKKCVYKDNQCFEQFKDCDSYNNSGETIEKTVCESIILNDENYKCAFNKQTKTCQKVGRCDFDLEFEDSCESIPLSEQTKKCSFVDSTCSEINKSCLELESINSINEDTCKTAPTSEINKKCKLKKDNTGCEEINDEQNSNDNDNKSKGEGKWFENNMSFIYILIALFA